MPQPSPTQCYSSPFIELQSVDSTNNYARQQIHAGLALHGTAYFAHEQLAGKGQRGKVWATEKDANIILSLVIKPQPLQLALQFQLSTCVAVSVHEFFSRYAGENTKIKWPNDLYWQDRKAGGILIENIVGSQESGAGSQESGVGAHRPSENQESAVNRPDWISIIGIGININQTSFHPEIKNPVSLKQITGKNFDPVELAKELCIVFDKCFKELTKDGFENTYNRYLAHMYKINEVVKFKRGSSVFEAVLEGVSSTGKLIIQHGNAREEFDFGEIEFVIR